MRVLIVDDEALARRRLARMLREIPGIEVVGEAGDGHAALAAVQQLRPDLMLLDVRMPGLDGISLALSSDDLPDIIFVTAYDEHAVEAFEVNAVDYLLKPVRRQRLAQAIERARERRGAPEGALGALLEALGSGRTAVPLRVSARERGTTRLFDVRSIVRFYASDKLTGFVCDGREHLADETLNELERRLCEHGFLRVHRGELINLARVRALHTQDGLFEVEFDDGQRARVSRRSLPTLRAALGLT